jgi:hypothetical protein
MSEPFVARVRSERNTQNLGIKSKSLHGLAVFLPVCAAGIAVDGFCLCTAQFALICGWACTHATMSFALSFAPHGRSAALSFGSFGRGIASSANDIAPSGGQR